ncbi:MAG: aminopeptidase P family protein, partial [Nitrospirae bacterium]|nr:aminopeptidase P family protein [Nitrospirota bacterium]
MDNILLIASSESDANIYYASRFLAPDSFIYLATNGKSFLLMSDLEVDRARAQSKVDHVLSYSDYEEKAKQSAKKSDGPTTSIAVVSVLLKEQGITDLTVPFNFPLEYGDALRALGYKLSIKKEPLFEARAIKTADEVAAIRNAQISVESAVDSAMDILRKSKIEGNHIYSEGVLLTSEFVRQKLHLKMMEKGCVAEHTIIACGVDACDPHNVGAGPLRANEPIIFDVFPRSIETRYFADMSRTVVKGIASNGLKKLYDTVLEGQELGISRVRSGANGKDIHEEINLLFENRGYKTGRVNGRMEGFFHGTGHGVGLDIHEHPSISRKDCILQQGEVVTVEPGLY